MTTATSPQRHLLRAPWEDAEPRRDCKRHDCLGENVPDLSEVTCPDCLRHARDRDETAWATEQCEDVVAALTDPEDADDDGFDVWHVRASAVCLALHETVSVPVAGYGQAQLKVEWYCKLTPIPERFRNAGWNVKVCYRLDHMSGYEHYDEWVPADTDVYTMTNMVMRARRGLVRAIGAGYALAASEVPA